MTHETVITRARPRSRLRILPAAIVAATVCALVGGYQLFWNVTVLDYGNPKATFFQPDAAPPGGRVLLWITDVRWEKLWPSTLFVSVHCKMRDPADQSRIIDGQINLEPHVIDVPVEKVGRLPKKARPFVVPAECLPGDLWWDAYAQSTGGLFGSWNPRIARPPKLHLTVLPPAS